MGVYVETSMNTRECHSALVTTARTAFAVFAALCFVGIFASLARGKVRQNHLSVEGARDG